MRGESNVAIVPAIGGYGVEDIYLGEFSPQLVGANPDTATTTHAYTTGSKLTYTLAGDSSPVTL